MTSQEVFEVPLVANGQRFGITLVGNQYTFTVVWRQAPYSGWVLDIGDAENVPIAQGIPLVTGTDLLGQFDYLELGFGLQVQTDHDLTKPPLYGNLGSTAHLYAVPK